MTRFYFFIKNTLIIRSISYAILIFAMIPIQASFEKPLVVIIPSRNNNQLFEGVKRYKMNLDSVFNQNYSNYRIIYVDDNSNDGTPNEVVEYVDQKEMSQRFTLIANSQRYGPSRNRYLAAHLCDDQEIILFLDGDDTFSHNGVLSVINDAYNDPNVWLTYSQFKTVPNNTISGGADVPQSVIKNNTYRDYGWYYHSLKTCYAWLFKQIKLESLLYNGEFFPISSDLAEMLPMMEMTGGKFKYIPDILYHATQYCHNEVNVFGPSLMRKLSQYILKKASRYKALKNTVGVRNTINSGVDAIILSQDPVKIKNVLNSVKKNIKGLSDIIVFYPIKRNSQKAYLELANEFPCATFLAFEDKRNFKKNMISIIKKSYSKYLILAHEDMHVADEIDLSIATKYMNSTFAYGLYFGCEKNDFENQKKRVPIHEFYIDPASKDSIIAFQFNAIDPMKKDYHPRTMTLYQKNSIEKVINSIEFKTIDEFYKKIHLIKPNLQKIGLMYKHRKVKDNY